jgi:hypothetical protein
MSFLKGAWTWLFGWRRTAYYAGDEPKSRAQRSRETLGWADHPAWGEGSRSSGSDGQ